MVGPKETAMDQGHRAGASVYFRHIPSFLKVNVFYSAAAKRSSNFKDLVQIQLTLVISNSKGLSEIVRDIRTST